MQLIWAGILLSLQVATACHCNPPDQPSVIHCANRSAILDCVNETTRCNKDYVYMIDCLQGIPDNLKPSEEETREEHCVQELDEIIKNSCVRRPCLYYSHQHFLRVDAFPRLSGAKSILMYHHYYQWLFTLLLMLLTPQAFAL